MEPQSSVDATLIHSADVVKNCELTTINYQYDIKSYSVLQTLEIKKAFVAL